MHQATHEDMRLAGDEVPDPDLKHTFKPGGIEAISFKWIKEITMTKELTLQKKILEYPEP